MAVSVENKALAVYLRSIFGGRPSVSKFWDANNRSSVDILTVRDSPHAGVSSYGTLGLSDFSIGLSSGEVCLGVELLLALRNEYQDAANILSTGAFAVINSKLKAKPGTVFPRVVELYAPQIEMKHVFLVPPFLWNLQTQEFSTKKVAWLLAVPISEKERNFVAENGSDALESLFEKRQIDIFDLDRKSIV
jgi:antitoxin YqcF